MYEVSNIIVKHKKLKDIIYVNMSSSGKIEAAAVTMASLYHSDKVNGLLYVTPENYTVNTENPEEEFKNHGLSFGMQKFSDLPMFQILKPQSLVEAVISIIHNHGPKKFKELLELLSSRNFKGFGTYLKEKEELNSQDRNFETLKNFTNKWNNKLKRHILRPGTKYFIEIENGRDKIIGINEEGIRIARLSGKASQFEPNSEF